MLKEKLIKAITTYKEQLKDTERNRSGNIVEIEWLGGFIAGLELALKYLGEEK